MKDGVLVARILAGSWRATPPPPDFSARDMGVVERRLLASGAGGLAWWRIHDDPALAHSEPGKRFRDAFRMHALHARLHEAGILSALESLRDGDIEPLLIKGWSAAKLYPEPAMRPYGDIDLWVRDDDLEAATRIADGMPEGVDVDLEHDIELTGSRLDELFSRSRAEALGERDIPVLSTEDSLRVLAIHFLKSGGWRPLSLCDVAAAVESRDTSFDWDRCLTGNRLARNWVSTAISLAGRLLGADVGGTPAGPTPPRWLERAVLSAWAAPWPEKRNPVRKPTRRLSHPLALAKDLRERWPGPVEATVAVPSTFGSVRPVHLEFVYVLRRGRRYIASQGARR